MSSLDYIDLCRLCLVKDHVNVPIFEGEGDVRQIFLKIAACLPVKVAREDKLPKKICDDCVYKVESFYQFWNTTASAEKQLFQWIGEDNLEDKQGYVNVMKQEQNSENRFGSNVIQVAGNQNNMDIRLMDNMGLGMPIIISSSNQQQIPSVPLDSADNSVTQVQAVPSSSSHEQMSQSQTNIATQEEDDDESDDDNMDDECDGDEGLSVKEEGEDELNSNKNIESSTFVNVGMTCDQAGPSGLQQQKITEMTDIGLQQTTDEDPKSGRIFVKDISTLMETDSTPNFHFVNVEMNKRKKRKPKSSSIEVHSKISIWKCDICKKLFKSAYYLNIHKNNHEAEGKETPSAEIEEPRVPKEEPSQEEQFSEPMEEVENYEETETKVSTERLIAGNSGVTNNETNLTLPMIQCKICDFKYAKLDAMNRHYKRVHPDVTSFSCDQCKEVFKTFRALQSHENGHENPLMCEVCGKLYLNIYRLYEHQRKVHSTTTMRCEECRKVFVIKENFNDHMERHRTSKPLICDICGKVFKQKKDIRKHMLVHTDSMPYVCKICNRSFRTMNSVGQHLLLHTGKMLYTCDVCGKVFAQKAGLTGHRKKHAGPLPPLPAVPISHIVKDLYEQNVHNTCKKIGRKKATSDAKVTKKKKRGGRKKRK